MRFRLATWNINSVRLRAEQVARFVGEQAPDVPFADKRGFTAWP
jgi:exodeoxyribonuclease-3